MKYKKTKLQHLEVKGKKISKKYMRLILDATDYYASKLLSRQLLPHVSVIVLFTKHLDDDNEAECEIIGWGRKEAPRHFIIHVAYSKTMTLRSLLKVIAHEMVHVKQFAMREVDDDLTTWLGRRIPEDTNYWDHPWEIDAFGRSVGLYTRFAYKREISVAELNECPCKRKK